MIALLLVGYYFLKRNKSQDDYYVGGRNMGSWHIGLSVVATDVGGGFSIGLGGLSFVLGLSGSWMLFTGLIGAWLSAVFLIPKIYKLGRDKNFHTFPQVFGYFYNSRVAFIAGVISAIGYLGFTSSQLLAGAKLASASFIGLSIDHALIIMGIIAVIYTVMGGLKAVIYTDTVQWIILIAGLMFIGLPMSYWAVGGYTEILAVLPESFFSLANISWQQIVNWTLTIIPIWFIGMTLYQRIYASRDEKTAKKAWFIAGVFEYPIMAFMGVALGLIARVAAEQGMFVQWGYETLLSIDPEMGLPLLLRTVLPAGLMGLMMAAYFSAVLSTADSCLMASSGNVSTDILSRIGLKKETVKLSQLITLIIGIVAVMLAGLLPNVLQLMLHSYAFMVSGLLIPLLAAVFFGAQNVTAAITSMISGGGTTLFLIVAGFDLPFDLDPIIYGILVSTFAFVLMSKFKPKALQIN